MTIKQPQRPGIKRVNLNIPIPLHNAFKAAVALEGVDMTTVLMEFMRDYVAKHSPKGRRK